MRKYFIILLLLVALPCWGANYAVRPPASCPNNGDGTSWACAAGAGATGAMNNLPQDLVHGDTYYLAGGTYGDEIIGTEGYSGSDYAYVKKATTDVHGVTTAWDNAYATGAATFTYMQIYGPYIEVDGVTGSGTTGYGIKVERPYSALLTDGDVVSLYIMMRHSPYGPLNITIKHVEVSMSSGECTDMDNANGAGWTPNTYALSASRGSSTNMKIQNCYIHGGSSNLKIYGWSYSEISGNYFGVNCSRAWSHGQQIVGNGATSHIKVFNNEFHDSQTFVLGAHQAFTPATIAGGNIYWDFYNNLIIGGTLTAGFAMAESGETDGLLSSQFHNNTFVGVEFGGRGAVFVGTLTDVVTHKSYAYNNLFYNCINPRLDNPDKTAGAIVHDNNAFLKSTGYAATLAGEASGESDDNATSAIFTNYATGDYSIAAANQVAIDHIIGQGKTLASPFDNDILGVSRTAPFDIGAYDVGGEADTTAPTLAEVTPVSTPSSNQAPSYVFSSDEAGTVTYGGTCGNGSLSTAVVGNNTVEWNLGIGAYSNCTITVTDAASNASTPLAVTEFVITPAISSASKVIESGVTFMRLP
jgi:hypothetical protein